MIYQVPHYINGKPVLTQNPGRQPVFNPATGEIIGEVNFAMQEDVNRAVDAALAAFPRWSATPPLRRARVLFKFKELLEQHLEEVAAIVTREQGKTLEDSRGSVLRGLELIEYYCGIANLLKGEYSENINAGLDSYTTRHPLGVCVGVSPFNFPVMVPLWMMAPAIACGNTFILKPSEKDPSASIRLLEFFKMAGLPDGVVNVLQGDKTTVEHLITHPKVAAVSCVGSTPVAESIYLTAVKHGKRAHTFGGAKNHAIVMPDADIHAAAQQIAGAAYGAAGERCMAISAAVAVTDSVADKLIEQLRREIATIKVGPGTDPQSQIGPLITREHWQKVKNYIDAGVKEGASLVVDGRQSIANAKGFFMGPTLFDQVTASMSIYREEIFGPVLVVVRVPDFAHALQLVNDHEYGNGVAVFTRDGATARTFADKVQAGMVGINVPIPVPAAYLGFGGWKRSKFGDIRMHSDSVAFYTQTKTITVRWPDQPEGPSYHMPVHQDKKS
jgi:malonate-semialdehyde dehydrogenase (acetylating) / methylmalonate-semialdehyde dehydrogenase